MTDGAAKGKGFSMRGIANTIIASAAGMSLVACMALSLPGCSSHEPEPQPQPQEEQTEQQSDARAQEPVLRTSLDETKGTLVVNEPECQIYEIVATSETISFAGSFSSSGITGTGRITVKLLDENRNMIRSVGSSTGAGLIRDEVEVVPGAVYCVEIDWAQGSWTLDWEGAVAR